MFVSGWTFGSLGGPNAGGTDFWLARHDRAGDLVWIRQLGSSDSDESYALAPDGNGGVFVAGHTAGGLGGTSQGLYDCWVARYDALGNHLWIRQLGTSASDETYSAATDGAGGVFVVGYTLGSLGEPSTGSLDAWLAHYDGLGTQQWIRQFGTSGQDGVYGAASDGSRGVYLAGITDGSLGGPSAGSTDAWFARFDGTGNQVWIRQIGTVHADEATCVALDGSAGVIAAGSTFGPLGNQNAGSQDIWLASIDGAGQVLRKWQFGSAGLDHPHAATGAGSGAVYVVGATFGDLVGQSSGNWDAWLARQDFDCHAPATYCTTMVSSSGCTPAMGSSGAPSLSHPDDFVLSATQLERGQNGFLFFGVTGPNSSPFFGGHLCVMPALYRLPVANTGSTVACQGSLGYSLANLLFDSGGGSFVIAGQFVHAQAWTRDLPAASGVNLSNGLSFSVCP